MNAMDPRATLTSTNRLLQPKKEKAVKEEVPADDLSDLPEAPVKAARAEKTKPTSSSSSAPLVAGGVVAVGGLGLVAAQVRDLCIHVLITLLLYMVLVPPSPTSRAILSFCQSSVQLPPCS